MAKFRTMRKIPLRNFGKVKFKETTKLSKYGDELRSVKTRKLKFENEFKKNQILGKHEEKIFAR